MSESIRSTGLDDFTAINGVGPVTAGKLHAAGLYTYDDLQVWWDFEVLGFPEHQANRIRAWLDQRTEQRALATEEETCQEK